MLRQCKQFTAVDSACSDALAGPALRPAEGDKLKPLQQECRHRCRRCAVTATTKTCDACGSANAHQAKNLYNLNGPLPGQLRP